MFKQIAVAVDGSEHSMTAAALAADIAARTGAQVDAVFVKDAAVIHAPYWRDFGPLLLPTARFDSELDAFFETRGTAVLDTLRARHAGMTGRIVSGRVDQVLLGLGRDFDLLAVGAAGESHEETGDDEHLGGRVERLAPRVNAPMLVAPREYHPLERVLLAYSAPSGKAVTLAADTGAATGLPVEVAFLEDDDPETSEDERAARAREVLAEHGLTSAPAYRVTGRAAAGLKKLVRPGDLVVISNSDFDLLGDTVAALRAPILVPLR